MDDSIPRESRKAAEQCRRSKRRLATARARMKSVLRWSVWLRAKHSADHRNSLPSCATWSRRRCAAPRRAAPERIKGYTIAVEALGRAENFDPQADPIVRVEAMRLRRALTRYYENGGKHDPVVIALPLGNYVPMFRRVAPLADASPAAP